MSVLVYRLETANIPAPSIVSFRRVMMGILFLQRGLE